MVENRPDPNLSQRIAANPAVSAWVDASAGSGKTKVLTDRVLALLLQSARPHAILCLTFTKAAAGEMANRIAGRLSSWARMDEPALAEDLASLGGRTPDGETLDRARRLFARVQEAPGGVRIDTMHAFCQGVLQRFPVEAKVPPHFAVLDERDQRTLLAQARDGLVLEIARHPDTPLAQAWERVLARLSESTFAKLMGELVKNRPLLLKAQASDIAHALEVPAEATTETLVRSACEDAAFDGPGLRSLIQPMLEGSATVQKIAGSLSTWLENTAGHRDFKALCAALLNKDGTPTKLERFNPFKSNFALHELIQTEQARLVDVWDELSRAEALADTQALLTVAKQLLTRYEQAKRIRSQLDYDDLIEGAARLLVDPGAAWVHYKLDEGIDHVLVDEAQDTSPPQWQVIAGLIEEFFAGESVNERHRTFFAVGDPKQSIYSFQGADPHEFRKRRQEFSTQAKAAAKAWEDVPLNTSFRSAPPVLRLVDAVFETADGLGLGDGAVKHYPHRADAPAWVEVWPLMPQPEDDDVDDVWQLPRDYESSLTAEEQLARTVARKIKGLVDSGEVLAATGKPIRPQDIMVLVRRRRRFGGALVAALKRLGVPVAGVDRMALTRQLVVEDLTAFGQFLLLPSDDLNLASLLKGPLFAWDEERLFRLAYRRDGSLWAALQASPEPINRNDAVRLQEWLRRAPALTPFALYSSLLTAHGGRAAIRERLGPEAEDPLDEFLALALGFPRHGPPTLQHFLHWLAADDIEIKRELEQGERDEVRLLTVHAAKGLQAPILFLPDTAYAPQGNKDSLTWNGETPIWAASSQGKRDGISSGLREQKQRLALQEEARLLYVALTRAEDRLYIGGWAPKRNSSSATWYQQIVSACERLVADGQAEEQDFAFDGLAGGGFVLGEPPQAVAEQEGELATKAIELPRWALEPAPVETAPARPLAPSRPSPPPPAARSPLRDKTESAARFRRGTLLHRLFQFLPGTPAAERQAAAARMLADAALDKEVLNDLVVSAAKVLDDPAFAAVFSNDALAEAPLTGLVDGLAVSGVVDRLLITPERVLIVDYKTNRAPPAGPATIPPGYQEQMRTYARLLQAIYPDRLIEAALLWTEVPRLDAVPLPHHVN